MHIFKHRQKEKTALVLSGGGSKGSYQLGVWKALRKLGVSIDIVTGTSVGAVNGAMVCLNDFHNAERLWLELETEEIFDIDTHVPENLSLLNEKIARIFSMPPNEFYGYSKDLFKHGGVSGHGLTKLLEKYISEDKIRKSHIEFGLVTVKFPSLECCRLFKNDIPLGRIRDFIQASASCFPFAQAFDIDGQKYIDGGFSDNLPVSMAIDAGAKRIIIADLQAVGRVDENILKTASENAEITHIKCTSDLGNFLSFDPKQAARNIRIGYLDTLKSFSQLEGRIYCFEKNSIESYNLEKVENCAHIFKLDPLTIYSEKTLIEDLKLSVLDAQINLHKSPFREISFHNISDPQILKRRIFTVSKKLTSSSMTVLIAENLKKHSSDSMFRNNPLSGIFSKEISAAEYLIEKKLIND